jgi:hypothetical protein
VPSNTVQLRTKDRGVPWLGQLIGSRPMPPLEQRVFPMLSYEDVGRAAEGISQAFGFEERERFAEKMEPCRT